MNISTIISTYKYTTPLMKERTKNQRSKSPKSKNPCVVTVQLSTRVCADPEASQIFLDGVLEAGKKAEELLLSKGIRTDRSSVTPSKSSVADAAGEPSPGVKSTAPKFKERSNPNKSRSDLKVIMKNLEKDRNSLFNGRKNREMMMKL
jgi:hypothetical protein